MDKTRRKLLSSFSLCSLGLLTGCIPTAMNNSLVRRIEETISGGPPEDLYKSQVFGDNSSNSYSFGVSNHYSPERTNMAIEIFDGIINEGVIPLSLPIPTESQVDSAISLFNKVKEKYANKKELETNETYEIMQHMLPMIRMYFDVNSINPRVASKDNKFKNGKASVTISHDGSITIPPGYMITSKQKGYCLDSGLPAPGQGEKLSLVPSSELIPKQLMPLYKAMQYKAYVDPSYRNEMQQLMWTLRSAGQQYGLAAHVNNNTLQKMENAMPGGAKLFVDYHNAQRTQAELLDKIGKKLAIKSNGKEINPFDLLDEKKSQRAFNDLFNSHVSAMNSPVTGEVPRDNRNYQMISPGIATFSIGEGTLTPQIMVVNSSSKPYTINFSDWVMEPARKAQRIAMYPPENITSKEFPVKYTEKQISLWEKIKEKLDRSMLSEAARFLNEKILKNVSKMQVFRDFAFRYLGNNPAVKKAIEAMPYLGNAISLYEAVSGKNWINGRDLNAFERIAAGLGTIPGGNFLKSAFKEKLVQGAQMAFAGAGFATNAGLMEKEIAAYAKTFNNPISFVANYADKDIETGMRDSLVRLNENPTLSKEHKQIIMRAIRENN